MSADARKDLPRRERVISIHRRRITTTETRADTARDLLTNTLTKSPQNGPISQAMLESGVRIETSTEPNRIIAPFCMTSAMPRVRISWV